MGGGLGVVEGHQVLDLLVAVDPREGVDPGSDVGVAVDLSTGRAAPGDVE